MTAKRRMLGTVLGSVSCAVLVGIAFLFVMQLAKQPGKPPTPKRVPAEFDSRVPITEVTQTVVVPTLDTPLSEGQSAVWCASFQLAWDRLKADITQGPVQIRNAEIVTERLNRAHVSAADLQGEDYFAVAGTAAEGVAETIEREMTSRFPNAARPEFHLPAEALCAFAFLAASVPWRYEYHDNPAPLDFTDAAGHRTPVRSFGILDADSFQDGDAEYFRGQAALLWESEGTERTRDEFAVDLCRHSTPYQVVLARVVRKATLDETLNDIQHKIERTPPGNDRLGEEDTLLVPTMHWRIHHHFKELEGPDKVLTNGPMPGLFVAEAVQGLQFRLDRRGAEVASGAHIVFLNGGPRRLHFDRPFLLYVKNREGKQPFLVMWVENAELMQQF